MPTSAIEQRLVEAFAGLNPELRRMILPAFAADLAASRAGAMSTDRLRLVKPRATAAAASAVTHLVDQLQQLAAIAPHDFHDLRQEIDRRLAIVQRAQAAHIDAVSQKPWPWPLYHAVRKAPGVSAAARILHTVLDATPAERPDIVTFARAIRSADQRAARVILNLLLEEYAPPSAAARFEREA